LNLDLAQIDFTTKKVDQQYMNLVFF